MNPMPGSCTVPRLSNWLSSWRIWSPTLSGRWEAIGNSKFEMQNAKTTVGPGHPGSLVAPFAFRILHFELRSHRHPLHRKHFDDVADLQVAVVAQADAAFEARLDLADIVLEPAQRADLAFVHDDVVAQQAGVGLAGTGDTAVGDHAAGDRADFRHLEHLAHLRRAEPHFFEGRL